jgi:hypothetical protein
MPVLGIVASQQVLKVTPPILTDLATWIDASDATSVTLSSGKVSQINDLSGNGRHLVQATSTNQPTYSTNVKNGLNAMQMSGSQWVRQSTNWTPTDPITFYWVGQFTNNGTVYLGSGWSNYRLDLQSYQSNSGNGAAFQVEGNNCMSIVASGTNISDGVWRYLTELRGTGTDAQAYANTTLGSSSSVGGSGMNSLGSGTLTLGTRSDGAVPMSGYIGEAMIYLGKHNSTQLAAMHAYFAAKWGI